MRGTCVHPAIGWCVFPWWTPPKCVVNHPWDFLLTSGKKRGKHHRKCVVTNTEISGNSFRGIHHPNEC